MAAKVKNTVCTPKNVSAIPANAKGKVRAMLIKLFCRPNTLPRIWTGVSV